MKMEMNIKDIKDIIKLAAALAGFAAAVACAIALLLIGEAEGLPL